MDLHIPSLGTLVSEGHWCVFWAAMHEVHYGLTYILVFYWYSLLISHTHRQTNTHSTLIGSVGWHTHINIYLYHLLCAYNSYLYYIKWLNEWFTDMKNLISTMLFFFKNYSLVKVTYLLIRCYKTRFFLWNTGIPVRIIENRHFTDGSSNCNRRAITVRTNIYSIGPVENQQNYCLHVYKLWQTNNT